MPLPLQQALTDLASQFSLSRLTDPALGKFRVQLVRPGPGPAGVPLKVSVDQGTEMVLKDSHVALTVLAKSVRFANADIANNAVLGGMPIVDVDPVPFGVDPMTNMTGSGLFLDLLKKVTEGAIANPTTNAPTPGVPGLVGAVDGTLQVPMEIAKTANDVEVQVEARLTLKDAAGNPAGDVTWSSGSVPPTENAQVVLPATALFNQITGMLSALTQDLDGSPNVVVKRYVHAEVRLGALGTSTGWVSLQPPLEVVLPVLRIPTMFVGFRFTDFTGNFLIVVPGNSQISTLAQANTALSTVRNAVTALGDSVKFATFFLNRLSALTSAIAGAPAASGATGTSFAKGNQPNLNDITLVENPWWDNNMEAEDEFSSMFFLGPMGRVVKIYNARGCNDGEGQMNVTIGNGLIVSIRDLDSKSPVSLPVGRLYIARVPGKGGIWPAEYERTFHNEISSLKFP